MDFIYVFDEASRDILLNAGYTMLRETSGGFGHIFIFATGNKLEFNQRGIGKYVLSNSLAF